jgi:hypothetical protein
MRRTSLSSAFRAFNRRSMETSNVPAVGFTMKREPLCSRFRALTPRTFLNATSATLSSLCLHNIHPRQELIPALASCRQRLPERLLPFGLLPPARSPFSLAGDAETPLLAVANFKWDRFGPSPTSDGTPRRYLGCPRGRGSRAAPPRRGATLTLVATARHNLLQGWHRAAPAQAAPQDQVLPQALPSSHDGG